ncbi:MAG: phosphotransferase [Tetrasphaera sp.]
MRFSAPSAPPRRTRPPTAHRPRGCPFWWCSPRPTPAGCGRRACSPTSRPAAACCSKTSATTPSFGCCTAPSAPAGMTLYERAVDLLADWQRAFPFREGSGATGLVYSRTFDRKLIRWELDHFRERGLEAWRRPLTEDQRAGLDAEFDALSNVVAAMPRVVMHRDWQSKNLMLHRGAFVVIDFKTPWWARSPTTSWRSCATRTPRSRSTSSGR